MDARARWRTAGGVLVALAVTGTLLTTSGPPDRIEGTPVAAQDGAAPDARADEPDESSEPIAGADGGGDAYYPDDGNGGYDVQRYDVGIRYDPATTRLDGDTTVTARATHALSSFNLDLYALEAFEVWVDDEPAGFEQTGEHELVVTPAEPLPDDAEFRVRVRYGGEPRLYDEGGLGAGGWYSRPDGPALAAGEPHSAAAWYPANDTPRDKAEFALTATVPDGWTAISNGIDSEPTSEDGWTTFSWRLDEPVATYLTTVAIDRFVVVRSELADGTPVIDAYSPGAGEAARADEERLPEIIEFLESVFGPYPFDSAGGIFLSESIGYALELQTRSVYSPDPGVGIIVHENAHQWFGNSVSLANWADMCLNECLASYSQWLWDEHEGADLDARYRDTVDNSGDRFFGAKLYDMGAGNEFFGVYSKGPAALHALRTKIGDEDFFAVLRGWADRHADSNASWPEFEDFVEEVSGEDLGAFFQAWFRDDSKPADEHLYPRGR